jgi:predicted ATP-dependent serine protease
MNNRFETKVTDPNKVLFRLKADNLPPKRFRTYIDSLDSVTLGGIPYGLTILFGESGTGKSKFAQEIAKSVASKGTKVLYVYAESQLDIYDIKNVSNIYCANFIKYLPKWADTIDQIKFLLNYTDADLLIIDSSTTLFSNTTKAVEEAEVRTATFDLKEQIASKIPVIAVSQIRGQGMFTYPAGGRAVDHAGDMNIEFELIKATIENGKIRKSMTDRLYTLQFTKDKQGAAISNKVFKIDYTPAMVLTPLNE